MRAVPTRPSVKQVRDSLVHGLHARLRRSRGSVGFRHIDTGRMLSGLTGLLQKTLFGEYDTPSGAANRAGGRRGGVRWNGRKRGTAVDSQLTRVVNGKTGKKTPKRLYQLTSHCLAAFERAGLRPVIAQYAVCSIQHRIGSAADVIALDEHDRLTVVEVKCGYSGDRSAVSLLPGTGVKQHMRGVLSEAADCVFHRHLSQLAATVAMLELQRTTLRELSAIGVRCGVAGLLLYVDGETAELVSLPEWWRCRGESILRCLASGR